MAEFAVTGTGKDRYGDITSLCGTWGRVEKSTAIQAIQLGNSYYVPLTDGSKATIEVVHGANGPYLRTNWDGYYPQQSRRVGSLLTSREL